MMRSAFNTPFREWWRTGWVAVTICLIGGCAPHRDLPVIEMDGDESMDCQQIAAAYTTAEQFGEDASARENQLDRLAAMKNCHKVNTHFQFSATFYSD